MRDETIKGPFLLGGLSSTTLKRLAGGAHSQRQYNVQSIVQQDMQGCIIREQGRMMSMDQREISWNRTDWYWLLLTTTQYPTHCRNHLSNCATSVLSKPSKEAKQSSSPPMGQSQYILYATTVAVLNSHPTLLSVTAISDRAMHLQSRQSVRLTRKGHGWSKMACRVPRSKGSSGSLMFERDSASPSYENISLSNWLHSISIIMMDIFFPRGFSITFAQTCSSLQSLLDDWDMISNFLVFCCLGVCSDSTLELLWMAQSGTILLRSCSWLMLMASAMEILFDLRIMEARVLLPTLIPLLEASRKITTSLSESSKDSWLRWLLLCERVFLDRVTDRPISYSISWKLASRPRICWVPYITSLRKDSTFLCSCYGES